MRPILLVVLILFLVVPAAPAFAGKGEKCTADTQTCLNKMSSYREKGWMGVTLDANEKMEMTVKTVAPGSPAEKAGIKVGDMLVAMNGARFSDEAAMKKAKGDWKPGQLVTYTVRRDGTESPVEVTLAPMPEEVFAAMIGLHMIENHMHPVTETKAESPKK